MILNDLEIAEYASKGMIKPFISESLRTVDEASNALPIPALSFGLGGNGYDCLLADKLLIFKNNWEGIIDPKNFNPDCMTEAELHKDGTGSYFILPPHSCALGSTVESFNMPSDVMAIAQSKSTYCRCSVSVLVTPLEAGFRGEIVVEIVSHAGSPVKLYTEGILQLLFLKINPPLVDYAKRNGKYQDQKGITFAKA